MMPEFTPAVSLALLVVLGFAGGALFRLIKAPAPYLLGPLTAVGLANLAGLPFPVLPVYLDSAAQVVLGFYLGANITRQNYMELRTFYLPAAATAVWSVLITLAFGYLLYRVTPLSLATAVLSSSPGGAPEVSIIALSIDAEVATVTVMQIARLLAVILVVPFLTRTSGKNEKRRAGLAAAQHADPNMPEQESALHRPGIIGRLFTGLLNPGLAVALAGGLLFHLVKIPAGFMIGAMVAVGAASIYGLKIQPLPDYLRTAAFIVIGILIGQFFTRSALGGVLDIYPIILLLTGLTLLSCAALALFLSRVTGWPLSVCLLAAAPGGLIAMTTLATELDADPVKVSLLHLSRLVTIKLSLPLIVLLIS